MRETIDELLPVLEDPKASYEDRLAACDGLQSCLRYMDPEELEILEFAIGRIRGSSKNRIDKMLKDFVEQGEGEHQEAVRNAMDMQRVTNAMALRRIVEAPRFDPPKAA